jgi:hypothetical protein
MMTGVTASTVVGGGRMRTSTRMLTASFVESEMRTAAPNANNDANAKEE